MHDCDAILAIAVSTHSQFLIRGGEHVMMCKVVSLVGVASGIGLGAAKVPRPPKGTRVARAAASCSEGSGY